MTLLDKLNLNAKPSRWRGRGRSVAGKIDARAYREHAADQAVQATIKRARTAYAKANGRDPVQAARNT